VVELVRLLALALAPPAPPVTVVAKLPVVVPLELVVAAALEVLVLGVPVLELAAPEVPLLEVALLEAVPLAVVLAVTDELALVLVDASPEVAMLLVVAGEPVVAALVVFGLAVVATLVADVSVDVAPPVLEARAVPVMVSLVAAGSSTTVAQAKTKQAAVWMTRKLGLAQRERGESCWGLVTPWSSSKSCLANMPQASKRATLAFCPARARRPEDDLLRCVCRGARVDAPGVSAQGADGQFSRASCVCDNGP